MTRTWLLNLAAYSIQLTALVVSARVVAAVLRVRAPRPALWFWQITMAAVVVLPFAQTRVPLEAAGTLATSAVVVGRAVAASPFASSDLTWVVVGVLVVGAIVRTAGLALGLVRLHVIRHRSRPLEPVPAIIDELTTRLGISADVRVSDDVDGPVTVGLRCPTVLLPPRVLALAAPLQQAILCHELLHVRRRDWAQTVVEEVWCALLWFHPAARALVSRIALMREALVDRQTLDVTGDRRAYAQALLTFADPPARAPLIAPSFIRPRFLSQRIALLAKESPMSRGHVLAAFGVGFAVISIATAATASRFPITLSGAAERTLTLPAGAAGQNEPVRPGNGVSPPRVVKEVRPEYTPAALQAKIQGSVELDLVVLPSGDPSAIRISRSLDSVYGLDEAAVQAAAQWKFEPGRRADGNAVPVTITVEMRFTLK